MGRFLWRPYSIVLPGTRSTPPPTRPSPPATPSITTTQYVPTRTPGPSTTYPTAAPTRPPVTTTPYGPTRTPLQTTTEPDLPPSVPDLPTNEDVQNAVATCATTLDTMVTENRNRRNTQLFRKAARALRTLNRNNYRRAALQQLSRNVQRLNSASARYRNSCQRRTTEIRNYDQLDSTFDNADEDDDNNDDGNNGSNQNRRVAKAQRLMDAAAQCIEDYCGY